MTDYPSNLGHWERIEKSAVFVNPTLTIHLPTVVEDVCRSLMDLNAALRAAKAEAWDEGFGAGHEAARADLFGGHWCMDHNHPEEAA